LSIICAVFVEKLDEVQWKPMTGSTDIFFDFVLFKCNHRVF